MSHLQQLLLAQIDYSAWATGQILDLCSSLALDQLDRELGVSHSSILRTLRHCHDAERVWFQRLVEVGNERLPPGPAPEHSFEFLIQSWPELGQGYRQWLESASEADLTLMLPTLLPNDAWLRFSRWQIILHVVNHSTFHRGQIITMLRGFGVPLSATDITSYNLTL
jgi:uncharacterized damage-inducible protein DinB